jgi:hypothetical protein
MSSTSSITTPHAPSGNLLSHGGAAEPSAAAQGEISGFEGPEKTIEIDFVAGLGPASGIRAIPREVWDGILSHAACTILVEDHTSGMDSYVLSESSLFVFPWKIVIKTCGTTTLLLMLPELLRHVKVSGALSSSAARGRRWAGSHGIRRICSLNLAVSSQSQPPLPPRPPKNHVWETMIAFCAGGQPCTRR